MANQTDKEAISVHGTNPQNLVEYILRQKIYDSFYWKKDCFGLTAEHIVDKAVELKFVGGMYGEPQKPTEFICLILKMLQIQPDKEIILEFIKNDDFKYLRLLGAFYLRLVGKAVDIFNYLEPLLNDYRRVRVRDASGAFSLSHIDELVDQMLRGDYLFNIALPRLPARHVMEKAGQIEPRLSVLDDEFNEEVKKEEVAAAAREAEAAANAAMEREEGEAGDEDQYRRQRREKEKWQLGRGEGRGRDRGRSRSRSRERRRRRSRSRSRDRDRHYRDDRRRSSRSRSRDKDRHYRSSREDRRRRDRSRSSSEEGQRRERKRGRGAEGAATGAGGGEERGGGKDALSVEETNKLRVQLGLAPLK